MLGGYLKVEELDYIKQFNPELISYLKKEFQFLQKVGGKGLSSVKNIHVYKNKEGDKNQDNLICYMVFDKPNHIKLKTHKPGSQGSDGKQYDDAAYFAQIGIEPREYDLTNYDELLEFDGLISKIAGI